MPTHLCRPGRAELHDGHIDRSTPRLVLAQQPLHCAQAAVEVLGQLSRRRPVPVALDEQRHSVLADSYSKRYRLLGLEGLREECRHALALRALPVLGHAEQSLDLRRQVCKGLEEVHPVSCGNAG